MRFLKGIWLAATFVILGLSGCNNGGSTGSGTTAPVLISISISGPASVHEGGQATYTATAAWDDNTTDVVTPSWRVDPETYAAISAEGGLSCLSVPGNQQISVTASYTSGAVTKTAAYAVAIVNVRALTDLAISGPASVRENETAIRILKNKGFSITGIDVSEEMIKLAKKNHPEIDFIHIDIATWETEQTFDFIVAWDSIFHLPFRMQKPVLTKLCRILSTNGIIIYTFGNAYGEHTDIWHDDTFYYSSIGINENLRIMMDNGLTILHLELDQYPEKHVYTIAKRS